MTTPVNFPRKYITPKVSPILGRVLIGVVFLVNVQSAVAFLVCPEVYAPGFEIPGLLGEAMVRGFGVLFLMWNVPYAVALWHPLHYRVALLMAIAMQSIGLVGEAFVYTTLTANHALARASVVRFIIFDGAGLVLLITAGWITRNVQTNEE